MTEDHLRVIEAQAAAATPGPWEAKSFGPCNCGQCPAHVNVFAGPYQWPKINPPEATFIAAARTNVPVLVEEVRNLRWLLGVIGEEGDGPWANLARHALQPDTDLAKLKERWTK